MTIRSRLGAIFWISFLIAAVSIIQKGAVAEEMLGDFVRDGDYIPAAGDPMSPLERLLFVDIQDILENMQKKKPTDVAFMQGATKRSLLNVHIGKTGTILVNLSPKITPRTEFQDDDEFFNQLRMGVQIAGSRRLGRQDWGSVGAYFVFEQKLVNRSRPKSGRLKNLSPSKRSHVSRQFRVPPAGDLVVISAGHGQTIFPGLTPLWNWQRPIDPGVTQGDIIGEIDHDLPVSSHFIGFVDDDGKWIEADVLLNLPGESKWLAVAQRRDGKGKVHRFPCHPGGRWGKGIFVFRPLVT